MQKNKSQEQNQQNKTKKDLNFYMRSLTYLMGCVHFALRERERGNEEIERERKWINEELICRGRKRRDSSIERERERERERENKQSGVDGNERLFFSFLFTFFFVWELKAGIGQKENGPRAFSFFERSHLR